MILLSDIRDWLKDLDAGDNYYIGKLDNKQDKSIGVYQRQGNAGHQIALGGLENTKYGIKQVSILLHWNNNAKETEEAALRLHEKIIANKCSRIGETKVYYINLIHNEPIDVGSDDKGIYERVIQLDIYHERS